MALAAVMAVLVGFGPARAQDAADTTGGSAQLEAWLEEGVQALENDAPAAAVRAVQRVVQAEASYASPRRGAAAYWLGRAYWADGQERRAQQIWQRGYERLTDQDRFDARLARAHLHSTLVPGESVGYETAQVYRRLLEQMGRARGDTPPALRREFAQLKPVLPDQIVEEVLAETPADAAPEAWVFARDAGEVLLQWWRSRDPLPATHKNERLREHLRRIAYAEAHYADPKTFTGLDGRGIVYVRFGAPRQQTTLHFNDAEFFQETFRFGVPLQRSIFPQNEVWNYEHLAPSGLYVFIEKQREGTYRLGRALDLLPRRLRRGGGRSVHEARRAASALAAMQYIYGELSTQHIRYGSIYGRVRDQVEQQEFRRDRESLEPSARTRQRSLGTSDAPGVRDESGRPSTATVGNGVVRQLVQRSREQDDLLERNRDREMPRQHTQVGRERPSLPVQVRTARFLEEGGATRTEIYWSTPVEALHLPDEMREKIEQAGETPGAYNVIDLTAVQNTRRYVKRTAKRKRYFFEKRGAGFLTPQTVTVKGDTGLYHLALQWEQHPARLTTTPDGGREANLGRSTRLGTYRADSLQALSPDEGRLEMSDLKPMTLPGGRLQGTAGVLERATPYPYEKIGARTSLLLYFEVYHLTFGADDRTRYTVDYEVYRRTERGRLRGLFQGDREQLTSTKTTYTGRSRTSEEYILLDLSEVDAEEESGLAITVRVTDQHSGQTEERTIRFTVDSGSAAEQGE